jgi:cytochrome P450
MGSLEGLPPGPDSAPLRQALEWVRAPTPMLESCAARYGDPFTLRLAGMGTIVMLSNPEAIRQVLTGDAEVLRSGAANRALGALLGRQSLLLLDGREHLRERRLMLPPFHGERMRAYADLIAAVAERRVDRWPAGEPFAVASSMQELALEVIARAVFGVEEPESTRELQRRLKRLLDTLGKRWRLLMLMLTRPDGLSVRVWRRFGRAIHPVDELLLSEISRRRADPGLASREDILSLLLQARDDDSRPLDDEHIRDELMTLLAAGHDTTATALAWTLERLAREPALQERAAAGGADYLDAVVKETLRLRPVLPFVVRELAADYELGGQAYPAGVKLAPCVWLVHRRPDVYPAPEEFRPERFLERPPGTYSWIPFGGGVRRCLGASFALFEMRIVLEVVLRSGRLSAPDAVPEPMGRRGVTMAPARGGRMVFTPV